MSDCVFCAKVDAKDYDHIRVVGAIEVVDFVPLNPVTPGHRLFVPATHVTDAAQHPVIAAAAMHRAAQFVAHMPAGFAANIITSIGAAATQTVRHLHIHVVPRVEGDGVHLPWTGQVTA